MGTRADFYIGRGQDAEWIGSLAWDGDPQWVSADSPRSIGGKQALLAATEAEFRAGVAHMAETRDDFTTPDRGWPWPWDTSSTTDFAYAFESDDQDCGRVYASSFGGPWFEVDLDKDNGGEPVDEDGNPSSGPAPTFPDMSERQNVRLDSRGGGVFIL